MVFDDGLVYEFSVKNKTLQDIGPLMKLPKSSHYFGYSDENGVLYFIHSDAKNEKFITKFHKSFNNKGHITVPKSKRSNALLKEIKNEEAKIQYKHGVLMGHLFWTFGLCILDDINQGYPFFRSSPWDSLNLKDLKLKNLTTIWSTKKQVWIKVSKYRKKNTKFSHTPKNQ